MKWLCMKCFCNKDNHCNIHFYFMLTDYGVKSFFDKNWIHYESCTSRITLKARSWLLLKLTSISLVHRNRSWPVRGHVAKNRTLVRRNADASCISKIKSLIHLPKLSKSYFNNSLRCYYPHVYFFSPCVFLFKYKTLLLKYSLRGLFSSLLVSKFRRG